MTRGSVVTFGETMVRLQLPEHARAGAPTPLSLGIGGAESNVAIALARQDVDVTWIGHVGDDDFGSLVVREILGEGVRVIARRDPNAPTGLLVKEHRVGRPTHVRYYRAGSAASRLGPDDLDPAVIMAADVLHTTGISPALGPRPAAAVERAIEIARSADTLVSFDVNYRSTLWSPEQARPALRGIVSRADLVFAGLDEARLIIDGRSAPPPPDPWADAREVSRRLAELGPREVVIKLGAHGALALRDQTISEVPAVPVVVVDPVGAGDAFVGGYLGALLAHLDVSGRLALGAQLGALVCRVPGDWEGLLGWDGVRTLEEGADVRR